MAFFRLDKEGKADVSAAGASLTETVISPSHFFIINNSASAVRMKVSNSSAEVATSAGGNTPAHNVHSDGSYTIQAGAHLTLTASTGGTGGVIDVTVSEVRATHMTSATIGDTLYIAKDANASQP